MTLKLYTHTHTHRPEDKFSLRDKPRVFCAITYRMLTFFFSSRGKWIQVEENSIYKRLRGQY